MSMSVYICVCMHVCIYIVYAQTWTNQLYLNPHNKLSQAAHLLYHIHTYFLRQIILQIRLHWFVTKRFDLGPEFQFGIWFDCFWSHRKHYRKKFSMRCVGRQCLVKFLNLLHKVKVCFHFLSRVRTRSLQYFEFVFCPWAMAFKSFSLLFASHLIAAKSLNADITTSMKNIILIRFIMDPLRDKVFSSLSNIGRLLQHLF